MAKSKFTLTASPTFEATVAIPVPGKGLADVVFTFKHRDRKAFRELMDSLATPDEERSDASLVLDIASGWDLAEPFDAEHVEQMLERYMGSGQAILNTYIGEQTGARQKN